MKSRKKTDMTTSPGWGKLIVRDRQLIVMTIPMLLFFLIFCYVPMAGLSLSFVDF